MAPGRREELLVLLPGLDGTGRLFVRFQTSLDELGIQSLAIAYPAVTYQSHDALADDVCKLIPSDRPISLLGESFGASLALKLAHRSDLRVSKVILCAPAWRVPPRAVRRLVAEVLGLIMPTPLLAIGLGAFGLNGAPKSLRREVAEVVSSCEGRVLRSRLDLLDGVDVPALVVALQHELMLIQPSSDRLSYAKPALAEAAVAVIPGPHFILQAEPKRCAEAVATFLSASGAT